MGDIIPFGEPYNKQVPFFEPQTSIGTIPLLDPLNSETNYQPISDPDTGEVIMYLPQVLNQIESLQFVYSEEQARDLMFGVKYVPYFDVFTLKKTGKTRGVWSDRYISIEQADPWLHHLVTDEIVEYINAKIVEDKVSLRDLNLSQAYIWLLRRYNQSKKSAKAHPLCHGVIPKKLHSPLHEMSTFQQILINNKLAEVRFNHLAELVTNYRQEDLPNIYTKKVFSEILFLLQLRISQLKNQT